MGADSKEWGWARSGERDSELVHRREESLLYHKNLHRPLGMGADSKEKTQNMICYKVGSVTGRLQLEERWEGEDGLPDSL